MKSDWVSVIEAAMAPAPDDESWAKGVLETAAPIFGRPSFLSFAAVEHPPDGSSFRVVTEVGQQTFKLTVEGCIDRFGVRALYYPPRAVVRGSDVLPSLVGPAGWAQLRASFGTQDVYALFAHPVPGVAAVLCAGSDVLLPPLSRQRARMLTQISLHIEAGLRLRRRPQSIKAVVTSEGRIVHFENGAPNPTTLTQRVHDIERARSRRSRGTAEGLALWQALVDGSVSLVERREGTRRYYLVLENAPEKQPMRAFTTGEIDAASYAARGLSAKLVSYALGISEPRVSSRLASAAMKVGLATRIELVRIAAMLTRDPRARFAATALTTTEHDVLELLGQGLSNAEIATIRNRSVRTIANQVAQLLRKTRTSSRRDLVTRHIA
jgi:DNA-binding CsgD family transcriptional regulator